MKIKYADWVEFIYLSAINKHISSLIYGARYTGNNPRKKVMIKEVMILINHYGKMTAL